MKHYYLVDFENVKSAGLSTIQPSLKKNDHVYVFYSDKANTVNIEILQVLEKMDITLKFIKVKNGQKDALDWQLSTFLGFLISKNKKKKCKYHIVSKDHGFNILLSFWDGIHLDIITVEDKPKTTRKKRTTKNKVETKVEPKVEVKEEKVVKAAPVKKEPKKNENYFLLAVNTGNYQGVYQYTTHKQRQNIEKIVGCTKEQKKYFSKKQQKDALDWAGVSSVLTFEQLTMSLN